MKKILFVMGLLACIPVFTNYMTSTGYSSSYTLVATYEKAQLPSGAKTIDVFNNVEDARIVVVPVRLDTGTYEVQLSRIDTNFYQICGTSQYIETRSCSKYAVRDKAILIIESYYNSPIGEVIFLE